MMMKEKISQRLVRGTRVFLRHPEIEDGEEFTGLSRASKRFHAGLVNPPKDKAGFQAFIEKSKSDSNECLLVCEIESDAIIGVINFSQIIYGGFKNAYLGYYLFDGFTGKGFMTEGLNLALKRAFGDLRLHRFEANIQPENLASIAVVKRCGFTKEGFSRKYLKVGGKWCDHERWAIIKEDWKGQ